MARTPRDPSPSDLIDPEAPAVGGARIDTPAYAAAAEPEAPTAIDSDLVDVEAPPAGGSKVDTAAYAERGRPERSGETAAARAPDEPPQADAQAVPSPEPSSAGEHDLVDRAADALLVLVRERAWAEITLRDVALAADIPFADLYAAAPSKAALLLRLSRRMDREALQRLEGEGAPAVRDRLFEAFMSRLEVMEPRRDALLAAARAEGPMLAPALPRTVRALLEGSGVDTSGWRGGLRLAAFLGVWTRVLAVWRDDEGALNRTMAEIDAQLTRAQSRLARVRAGF